MIRFALQKGSLTAEWGGTGEAGSRETCKVTVVLMMATGDGDWKVEVTVWVGRLG